MLGDGSCDSDYLVIPGGSENGETGTLTRDRFCGTALGYCNAAGNNNACPAMAGPVTSE